jgi:hypothetical protein
LGSLRLPAPELAKSFAMPVDKSGRFDDHQCIMPVESFGQ